MRRFFPFSRRSALIVALLLAPAVPVALVAQDMSNEEQKSFLTNFVQDRLSTPERQIRLSNIDGILGSDVSINEITISDAEGVWLRVNNASLNWNQAALFLGRLEVNSLRAESIEYVRNAIPVEGAIDLPPPEAGTFEVPEFPVAIQIGELAVPSVTFGEGVFGLGSEISLAGSMTLEDGNLDAMLDIVRLDGPGGTLDLDIAYSNETREIDLGLALVEPPNGVIANLLNIENRPSVELTLDGAGPISNLEAQLTLLANDREALAGNAVITEQADGFRVAAELGGPLATLVAAPYRPFFGLDTRLSVDALVRNEGGFDISRLTLSGGQLDLSASASTTADNFLTRLDLDASIVDRDGGRVTLPVPGLTTVQSAQLQIAFGTAASDEWSSVLAVQAFETEGFAADTLSLNLGGVAQNLQDPATRRVTFNGDGALAGITAEEGVEAALGDSVGLGIAGLFEAGRPLQLAELRVVGQALTAGLSGTLDGLDFDGLIALETANIAPFSALAGRDLDGALSLSADGRILPLSGGFDLVFDGTGTDLAIGDPTADALLDGTVTLSGRLARTPAGITADDFAIRNAQVQFSADGSFASELADFRIALDLADLALLSDQASGALSVRGSARSTTPEAPFELVLDGTVLSGQLAGYSLRDARINFDADLFDGDLSGDLTGSAMLDGYRADLATAFATDATTQALSDLRFDIAGTSLTGAVTRAADTGLLDGRLDLSATDISRAAALVLADAAGALEASIVLTPEDGRQSAGITAKASGLRVNDIAVAQAQVTASIADLFGVPVIEGSATASTVEAGGVRVESVSLQADQSGGATRFSAEASGVGADAIDGFGIAPIAVAAAGSFADRVVQLDSITASGNGGLSVSGSGRVPLDGPIALALDGSAPLALANSFVADRGGVFSGTARFNANVGGTLASPLITGAASTAGAGYVDPELNLRLTDIAGRVALNGTTATVESLSANLATGGSVSARGTVGLSSALPANLDVNLNSARYADGDIFVAALSGALNLSGNLTGAPLLSGEVLVEEANITVPEGFGGGAPLLEVEHVRTPRPVQQTLNRARIDARDGTGGGGSQLQLDLSVKAPNQIFVRGRGLDAEVGGQVRLTGSLGNIQPVGAFSLTRGRLDIIGQRLDFETGTVTLLGDLDPQLYFVARTEGDGITVFVTLSGRVSEPDVTFTSNPDLPQDEVLSRLIFNRSMGELSPLQLARLAAAAAELVGGGGGGGLVDSLRGAAGLADLDVVTDDAGNVGVQAGTYIQDNVYLGVTAGSNGQSKVTINLDATEDLTIRGTAGQDGDTSLGIFYEQDY